jgi:hypothetical protein
MAFFCLFNQYKHSGHYMYHLLRQRNSPHEYLCVPRGSQRFSRNSIDLLDFVAGMCFVFKDYLEEIAFSSAAGEGNRRIVEPSPSLSQMLPGSYQLPATSYQLPGQYEF